MANVGNGNENWKRWVVVGVLVAVAVTVATDFGFWGTLVGIAGLVFAFWGLQALFSALTSGSVPETRIGSLDGQSEAVQLVGTARPVEDPLTAPLTGTECVAYEVRVQEYRPHRHHGSE